jgi:hypothetical protein
MCTVSFYIENRAGEALKNPLPGFINPFPFPLIYVMYKVEESADAKS